LSLAAPLIGGKDKAKSDTTERKKQKKNTDSQREWSSYYFVNRGGM